jgi:hypothetical protein
MPEVLSSSTVPLLLQLLQSWYSQLGSTTAGYFFRLYAGWLVLQWHALFGNSSSQFSLHSNASLLLLVAFCPSVLSVRCDALCSCLPPKQVST